MAFELPALPYAKDALEPHISAETLEFPPRQTPQHLRCETKRPNSWY